MTATEELRRLLDERGARWWQSANTLGCVFTRWHSPIFGDEVVAMENGEEGLVLFDHFMTPEQAIAATLGETPTPPPPTPPKQPPYDLLIDLLRDEWDIEASWDGLRRFWYVGLTDEGVRKRDEREATLGRGTCDKDSRYMAARSENEKLRELVRDVVLLAGLNGCDVTKMQMHAHGGDWRTIWERMSELGAPGTEVDA